MSQSPELSGSGWDVEPERMYVAIVQTWQYKTIEVATVSVSVSVPIQRVVAVFGPDQSEELMTWADSGPGSSELRTWVEVPRG